MEDFYAWNPAVGVDSCTNLLPDYYVCVGLGGTTTTPVTTAPATTAPATTNNTSGPVTTATSLTGPPTTSAGGAVSTPTPTQVYCPFRNC